MRLSNSAIVSVGLSVVALGFCAASVSGGRMTSRDPFQPPPRDPSQPPPAKKRTPKEAAAALLAYISPLIAASDLAGLGTKSNPSNAIAMLQRDMGAIKSDGIYGPKTAARGKALLGQAFPPRPAPKVTVKPKQLPAAAASATSIPTHSIAVQDMPTHQVEVLDKAPANTITVHSTSKPITAQPIRANPYAPPTAAPTPNPPPAPIVVDAATPTRTAKEAARALLSFASPLIRAGNLAELGTVQRPSDFVAAAQRDMRLLKSDGIYGPKTAARGKELLGVEFPARQSNKKRVSAPVSPIDVIMQPPPRPPLEAAQALHDHVTTPPVHWGTTSGPNPIVRASQLDMGGGLVADGVYGPKTKARAETLLGISFPPRP